MSQQMNQKMMGGSQRNPMEADGEEQSMEGIENNAMDDSKFLNVLNKTASQQEVGYDFDYYNDFEDDFNEDDLD